MKRDISVEQEYGDERVPFGPKLATSPDLALQKPAHAKRRPAWTMSDNALMWRVIGKNNSLQRRWRIAFLYWRRNWTAKEIAADLGCSIGAVKMVLQRIRGGKPGSNPSEGNGER